MHRSRSAFLALAVTTLGSLALAHCSRPGDSSNPSSPAASDSIAIPPPPPPAASSSAPTSSAPPPPAPTAAPSKPSADCGIKMDDWCPSPAGDPCGKHKDAKSCKADSKCKGMPFRGETFAPCNDDGRGFSTNCPTVGCLSR
ncbi:hypothetical protein LVJ94_43000 [Pendulispora rubella]|uniref:Uncharacterized protein n=1 Tax=Pendulispora rubella TaxID=2741070 RepID=A0ABZ2L1H6_9BACT